MYLNCLLLLSVLCVDARKAAQKPYYGDTKCDDGKPEGDCNLNQCVLSKLGTACEARFVRFNLNGQHFSKKTCRCLSEPICTPIELGQLGCTTYKSMSRQMQRSIRRWTMSEAEKNAPNNQYGNEYKNASIGAYSDHERHSQLLNGTTKFCCRIDRSAVQRRYTFKSKRPFNKNSATLVNSLSLPGFLLLLLLRFCF